MKAIREVDITDRIPLIQSRLGEWEITKAGDRRRVFQNRDTGLIRYGESLVTDRQYQQLLNRFADIADRVLP